MKKFLIFFSDSLEEFMALIKYLTSESNNEKPEGSSLKKWGRCHPMLYMFTCSHSSDYNHVQGANTTLSLCSCLNISLFFWTPFFSSSSFLFLPYPPVSPFSFSFLLPPFLSSFWGISWYSCWIMPLPPPHTHFSFSIQPPRWQTNVTVS